MFKKTIEWIKAHKLISLIIVIFLILVGVALWLLFRKEEPIPQAPVKVLQLISVQPDPLTFKSIFPVKEVQFYFDDFVDRKSIEYTVSPQAKTRIIFPEGPSKTFSILPLEGWVENVEYTIVIRKTLKSVSGNPLSQDIVLNLRRTTPQPGDPDYPTFENEKGTGI